MSVMRDDYPKARHERFTSPWQMWAFFNVCADSGTGHIWKRAQLVEDRSTTFWICHHCGMTSPGPVDNAALRPHARKI